MKKIINQRDLQGNQHGVWEHYYADGTLWWRERYHHGKPYGVSELYYYYGGTTLNKCYHLSVR